MCVQASPTKVGDYFVLETLGTGSTGKVKLGRHAKTGQTVALKFVRTNLIHSNTTVYEKFRREISVLKFIAATCRRLAKRDQSLTASRGKIGIMQLLNVFHYENVVVLVLEYCDGGELFDVLLREGCLTEQVILDYFQQLVHALSFCHHRGICHRDLKLENIILTLDGRLKIADFGMASLSFPGTFLRTSCGSPQYCAPEVIRGELYDGSAADVWSLGIILFVMTTGGLPFDDDNFHRLIAKIQSGAFYMPPEVPEGIANLISKMLVPDPAERARLEDVKKSPWFNSHSNRVDIYVEREEDAESDDNEGDMDGMPIPNADETVLRHLADLGLGDIEVIRRRLEGNEACTEKEYYHVLFEFCSHIKTGSEVRQR